MQRLNKKLPPQQIEEIDEDRAQFEMWMLIRALIALMIIAVGLFLWSR